MFGEIGQVESVQIITDRDTGRSKGFGFVQMSDDAAAEKAIAQLNGKEVADLISLSTKHGRCKKRTSGARVAAVEADADIKAGTIGIIHV